MKKLLTLSLIVFAFAANAQKPSTLAKADKAELQRVVDLSSKDIQLSDTAQWQLPLTAKQQAALKEIDDRLAQITAEYAKAQEAKSQYLKAIVEGKDVDVKNVIDVFYEAGVLTFKETNRKKP